MHRCSAPERLPDTDGQWWNFLQETSLQFSFKAASLMSLALLLLLRKYTYWLQIQLLLVYKYDVV